MFKRQALYLPGCGLLALSICLAGVAATDYTQLAPKPDRTTINQGLTSPTASFMKSQLGAPGALTTNCSPVTNARLKRLIVTRNFGPFAATGLKPATEAITRILSKVKSEKPELFNQLGTDGMLCVRKVRGGTDFSNHSWGTAIDIRINRKGDAFGDNKTMIGLAEIYPFFHAEKFYWGAGFSRKEDSMHFEASQELIKKWAEEGRLK
jgi:hypothetical protein